MNSNSSTKETTFSEYHRFKAGITKPLTTRGIVVSNTDPLFAGRVKVWIPAIHGPSPYNQDGILNIDPDIVSVSTALSNKLAGSSTFKDQNTINNLPWASVVSHNLGPSLDFQNGLTTSAGVFTTPTVGTEVILIFENDDPALPIVIGSIIHASEFRYSLSRPLEMLPGVAISNVSQTDTPGNAAAAPPTDASAYPTLVSSVYNIRTGQGSTLFISDDPNNRAIVLEGSVNYDKQSILTPADVATLSRLYPAFPTTASAAFAKREPLSSVGGSPLLAPNNLVSSGYTSGSITTTVSPATAVNSTSTATQSTINSVAILQGLNDCAAASTINKTLPVSGPFRRAGGPGGLLHAPRPYGLHSGIDVHAEATGSTALIAPIDCFPLYITTIPNVGFELLVLGVDGYGHGFLHLRSVAPNIQNIVNSGKTQLVKLGTVLGVCGITAVTSHNSGPHLHWDVWKAGSSVQSGPAISQSRLTAISTNQTIDGFSTWLHQSSTTQSSTVISSNNNNASVVSTNTGTPEQVASIYNEFSVQYSSSDAVNFSKPAGLEMSLTPGKETIMLRHPSGSFIGFDPDGNILIYSCGDINFRVNRSITYDVLGAIMENAYAKYSRIKTTIKNYSRMFFNYKAKDKADNTMPDFFSRVDVCRAYDMLNAVNSTINNSTIIDSSGNPVPASSILPNVGGTSSIKPYTYSPLPTVYNYALNTYDSILQTMYTKYISGSGTAGTVFTDISYFKAIMLVESNGTQSMVPGGLFNLTDTMFQNVKNWVPSNTQMLQYTSNTTQSYSDNADIAFQYIKNLCSALISYLQTVPCGSLSLNTNITPTDFIYLVLLAYVYGLELTKDAIKEVCLSLSTANSTNLMLNYKAVEAVCIPRLLNTQTNNAALNTTLAFVPTVELTRTKLSQQKPS